MCACVLVCVFVCLCVLVYVGECMCCVCAYLSCCKPHTKTKCLKCVRAFEARKDSSRVCFSILLFGLSFLHIVLLILYNLVHIDAFFAILTKKTKDIPYSQDLHNTNQLQAHPRVAFEQLVTTQHRHLHSATLYRQSPLQFYQIHI